MKYKSYRIIDGKPRWVIIDENGSIINRIPSKEELKNIEKEVLSAYTVGNKKTNKYIETNGSAVCNECRTLLPRYSLHKEYKKRNWTGRLLCGSCYARMNRYGTVDINKIKQIPGFGKRTNNLFYNKTNACDRCRISFENISGSPCREYDKEGDYTGKWLCNRCYSRDDYIERFKMGHRRTGDQDLSSTNVKGDNFQELTCRWRSTVSIIPVEDLNKKNDDYKSPIDHTPDSELGIIQTKGRLYDPINGVWLFARLEREWDKEFDYLICYCADKFGKYIERIYIFPKRVITTKTIGIYMNTKYVVGWYEKYRIKDEKILELVNKIYNDIIGE